MAQRILIVEDEKDIAELISMSLRGAGYETAICYDGLAALEFFRRAKPDLLMLDLMLPGRDGIEICRAIRLESGVPIVMLTARADSQDIVNGLEAGADDYLIKPVVGSELIARIRARLRKIEPTGIKEIEIGDLVIDTAGHTVKRGEEVIPLTVLEFKLLTTLAKRPWQVFTRESLLQEVWEYRHAADTRLVNVHVQRLRAKVEHDPENPEIVMTVRGVGYKAGSN